MKSSPVSQALGRARDSLWMMMRCFVVPVSLLAVASPSHADRIPDAEDLVDVAEQTVQTKWLDCLGAVYPVEIVTSSLRVDVTWRESGTQQHPTIRQRTVSGIQLRTDISKMRRQPEIRAAIRCTEQAMQTFAISLSATYPTLANYELPPSSPLVIDGVVSLAPAEAHIRSVGNHLAAECKISRPFFLGFWVGAAGEVIRRFESENNACLAQKNNSSFRFPSSQADTAFWVRVEPDKRK